MDPYNVYFSRIEASELAMKYVIGLMIDGERKSVEPMSVRVNGSERSMQRLLTEVMWDHEGVLQEYRRIMLRETSDLQGVLAVDDTGFPKKGKHSVCVNRQYCPPLGKIANCQIGVSLTYVGQGVFWTYAMDLFIPKSWDNSDDKECQIKRNKVRMPEHAHYLPKWQISLLQIEIARNEKVPHRGVVADSGYGDIPGFRKQLQVWNEPYVVGIHSNTMVYTEPPIIEKPLPLKRSRGRPRKNPELIRTSGQTCQVTELGKNVRDDEWEYLELRKNSYGKPLVVEAVSRRIWPADEEENNSILQSSWLIIERRRNEKGETDLRYFLSNSPETMPTIDMVRLYHDRFWIDHGYRHMKDELGLDHHEGRSWIGWYRHVVLVCLAYGFLTLKQLEKKKTPGVFQMGNIDRIQAKSIFPHSQLSFVQSWLFNDCPLRSSERYHAHRALRTFQSIPEIRHKFSNAVTSVMGQSCYLSE